ncbi:MAG: methyltransferase domain-containing protein, partial [Candidatus Omnitrophota bacterium]
MSVVKKMKSILRPYPFVYKISHNFWRFLKSVFSFRNLRIIVLDDWVLDEGLPEKMVSDPGYNSVIDDLLVFTGLSREHLYDRLVRKPRTMTHYRSEFKWHAPKDINELAWFYRCSYSHLFCNASHPYWTKLDFLTPDVGRVLDYAAGVGNNVIELATRGFEVDYLEINIIQEAFTRSRAERRGLENINFISPIVAGKVDPIKCIKNMYGAIVLQDILEHVPDYQVLLGYLIDHLKPGGFIIESSRLEEGTDEIGIHFKKTLSIGDAMKGMKQIEPN